MTDLATLGIVVKSDQVRKGTTDLNAFAKAADKADNENDQLAASSVKAGKAQANMNAQVERSTKGFGALGVAASGLRGILGGLFVGLGLEGVRRAVDGYTSFTNQLKVAGVEGENFVDVENRLFEAANRSGTAIGAVGTLYGRATLAAESLGASQDELLHFVDGVTAALKVQGGSTESASGALMQLSQALGGGTVRAEEFNSILEGAPTIARAAAAGIDDAGGSVSRLRSLVIEGKISSQEFFEGFNEGSAMMIETANGLGITIGMAFTTLSNGFIRLLGALDQGVGASAAVANAIQGIGEGMNWLAANITTVIDVLAPLAPLLIATFGPVILQQVALLVSAGVFPLINAVKALFVLLAANPLGIIVAGLVLLISYTLDWRLAIENLIKAWGIFMIQWGRFWGDQGAIDRGIRIFLDAEQAVADIEKTAGKLKSAFDTGGNDSAGKIENAMGRGGSDAAAKIAGGFAAGAAMTDEAAQAIYDNLNGKVVKPIGDTLKAGGKLIHNEITGAITKAAPPAGDVLGEGVAQGASVGAQTIAQNIELAGQSVGGKIADVLQASAFQIADIIRQMLQAEVRLLNAQVQETLQQGAAAMMSARADLINAQANQRNAANGGGGGGGSSGGGGGSGTSSTSGFSMFAGSGRDRAIGMREDWSILRDPTRTFTTGGMNGGGSFVVPGSGNSDTERVQLDLTPGERVTVTPNNGAGAQAAPIVKLTIQNKLSPQDMLSAMDTAEGAKTIANVIANDPQLFRDILGSQ